MARESSFVLNTSSDLYTNLELALLGSGSTQTVHTDSGPNALNGTIVAATNAQYPASSFDEDGRFLLHFDRNGSVNPGDTNYYISVGTDESVSLAGDFTIVARVRPASISTYITSAYEHHVISKEKTTWNPAVSRNYRIVLLNKTAVFTCSSLGVSYSLTGNADAISVANSFYTIIVRRVGTLIEMFINGVKQQNTLTLSSVDVNSAWPLRLCSNYSFTTADYSLDGDLSDVLIYSSGLSDPLVALLSVDTDESLGGLVPVTADPEEPYVPEPGGMLEWFTPAIGENLLTNPDFSTLDVNGQPVGWTDVAGGFSWDATEEAYRYDKVEYPWSYTSGQNVYLTAGVYELGGSLKTALETTIGKGFRLSLNGVTTLPLLSGTTDWTDQISTWIEVQESGTYTFSIQPYSMPTGSAWVKNVFLRRYELPIEAFLMYPNYRGILFDDFSQDIKVKMSVDANSVIYGGDTSNFEIHVLLSDESDDSVVYSSILSVAEAEITINAESITDVDASYILSLSVVQKSDSSTVFSHPSWRINKVSGESRQSMHVTFDDSGRFLVRDVPTFFVGAYDCCMGYTNTKDGWITALQRDRRLFEAQLNLYLNYWYGQTPIDSTSTLMSALNDYGMMWIQTANVFGHNYYDDSYFSVDTNPGFLEALSDSPNYWGLYRVDEAWAAAIPEMFALDRQYLAKQPNGVSFGAFLTSSVMRFWRHTIDVMAMDPYPVLGIEPEGGFDTTLVYDWVTKTVNSVEASRPVMAVLQFFCGPGDSRFPNDFECRQMTWAAIASGVNGILYWSLGESSGGTYGLSDWYDCPREWCESRVSRWEEFKGMVADVRSLDAALCAVDDTESLVSCSSENIQFRVKTVGDITYLFSTNKTNSIEYAVSFEFNFAVSSVSVYTEGRSISPNGTQFIDDFAQSGSHVYVIKKINYGDPAAFDGAFPDDPLVQNGSAATVLRVWRVS